MRHPFALLALAAIAVAAPLHAQQMTLAPDTTYTTKRILPNPAGTVTAYEVWQDTVLLGRVIQAPAGKWTATLPRSGIAFADTYFTLKAAARRLVREYNDAMGAMHPPAIPNGLVYEPAPVTYGGAFGCWYPEGLTVPKAADCKTTDQALRVALTTAMRRNGTGAVVERLVPSGAIDTVRLVDTVTVHTTITLPPDTVKPPTVHLPADTVKPPPVVLPPDTVRTSSGTPELPRRMDEMDAMLKSARASEAMPLSGDTIFIGAVGQPMRCVGPNAAVNCSVAEQRRILKCGTGYAAPACANYPPPTSARRVTAIRVVAMRRFPQQRGTR